MAYETTVRSKRGLFEKLRNLAPDEGVRVAGSIGGQDRLVFITRHSGKFAIWIRPTTTEPGKSVKGEFKDFAGFEALRKFLESVKSKPLRAYLY